MNQLIAKSAETTMSSVEIAELTGKEHRNVLADIRKMLVEIQSAEKSADYKD
ncbi:DNA-binding protein [Edwardsiella phage PVN06]|nr:DNA-binding protein [Edwardsiella phage PVN06]